MMAQGRSTTHYTSQDERWDAVARREAAADGRFVYAVATTGVFCRPSCSSRMPRRENVAFFDTVEKATKAGFRACMRCKPTRTSPHEERATLVVAACRLLEGEGAARTDSVAQQVGLSTFYFSRLFKSHVGVTPQEYRRRVLAERAKRGIARAGSVTAAIYDAGYASSSRFYDGVGRELGMAPRDARKGARGKSVRYAVRGCSLGCILVAWTERGACDVRFGDAEAEVVDALSARFPEAARERTTVPAWVDEVVTAVERPGAHAIPIDIYGTAFEERVWRELQRIPPGETRTYAQVACAIGSPTAARAVARACAANTVAVLVPCHRVVRADGAVAGYRWGKERKKKLLDREARGRT